MPITYLGTHNPDQYTIVGCCARCCHDDFPDTKRYDDYKEVRPDGSYTGASGKKINETPVIQYRGGKGNYHVHPVTGDKVQSLYSRILIKKVVK